MQIIPVRMHDESPADNAVIARAEAALANFEARVDISPCVGSHVSQVADVMLRCSRGTVLRRFRIEMLSGAAGIMRRAVAKLVYMHAVRTIRLESGQIRIDLCGITSSHESYYAVH